MVVGWGGVGCVCVGGEGDGGRSGWWEVVVVRRLSSARVCPDTHCEMQLTSGTMSL